MSLHKLGFQVQLVGRNRPGSIPMPARTYACLRMNLLFYKGPLFYAEYNFRLFLLLLFSSCDLLVSNDLDTALPNFFISRLRRIPMVYDSHEYFTETPELVNRPGVQRIWQRIEAFVLKRLDWMITVNVSIARLFEQRYGIRTFVIRNIPWLWQPEHMLSRATLNLPADKHILVLQGSGINVQRGAEELVDAMQFVENALLLVIGGGDVLESLKQRVQTLKLDGRVSFLPRMPYQQMMQYTAAADLGFTLDKDTNLNYRYSLPNKLFDYIQAGTPVVATPLPEISSIIRQYDVGCFVDRHEPEYLAEVINNTLQSPDLLKRWKKNCTFAATELCWENEEKTLLKLYEPYC
ncbi:MAG: glycosyltransferase [Bacteroidetes bacterium]|nr:glycosyltransferase [Bacteroidota bacterium]